MRSRARISRRAGAFTLVEMLIVIVVIGVLAGLLLPAISHARSKALETKCASNLRTWGQAFYVYNAMYDALPHTDDRARNSPAGSFDPRHPEHECCWVDVVPPLLKMKAWRDYPAGAKPTDGIWQCPAARPLADSAYRPDYKPSVEGWHSYAMNSYLEQDFEYGLPSGAETQPSFLPLARCAAPSQTILLFEQTLDPGAGYGETGRLDSAGRYTGEDARALSERHARSGGLGANIVYLDGHVGWRGDLWDAASRTPRIPKRGDLTWFPYAY